MKGTQKPAKRPARRPSEGFTSEERAAMKERADELKVASQRGGRASKADGFSDKANLDDGKMWPNAFALKTLTSADEARISALVKRAVS